MYVLHIRHFINDSNDSNHVVHWSPRMIRLINETLYPWALPSVLLCFFFFFFFVFFLKIMNKSNLEKELVYLANSSRSLSIIGGSQGRNLEVGTKAEAMEECCLLACTSWFVQPAFL